MGIRFLHRETGGDTARETLERRFGSYFPRAFAYAFSNVGDEAQVRGLVTEAFGRIFSASPQIPEEQFRIALFSALAELCRTQPRPLPVDFGLSQRERLAVTLTFDAGLSVAEAGRVAGSDKVGEDLQRALRKLQAGASPAAVPDFFQAP
jgi:DNA-directed RNA polymerase specialized sigma24 family protein